MAFWRKRYTSKHTGKEIDDAVDAVGQLPENIISNPMTAAGDLIVGGENGAAGKLAAGTSGQVLKIGASGPEWASDAEGMANPMTAAGDLIVGGENGAAGKLAAGTSGQVLKIGASGPEWASDAEGMANPMTAAGDIIVGGTDGAPARLTKGTDGQVLSMVSGAPAWAAGGAVHVHYIRFVLNSVLNKPNIALVVVCDEPQFTSFTSLCTYFYNKGFTDGTKLVPVACCEENIFSAYMFGFSNAGGCTIAGMAWSSTSSSIARTSLGVSNSGVTNFSDTVVL